VQREDAISILVSQFIHSVICAECGGYEVVLATFHASVHGLHLIDLTRMESGLFFF